jgi:3D (Asp-Asp-Asp) domain-containing protein
LRLDATLYAFFCSPPRLRQAYAWRMRFLALLLACVFLAGCASRPLPKYEKPVARTQFQKVRTTAYTHSESDHLKYGRSTAIGTTLQSGTIKSAAADWSRWPAGTLFRILETGELYQVDDYGWALAGTNTIDLYKPSRAAMNRWGVRRVTIENLRWGDPERSLTILRPRAKHAHVKRMIAGYRSHYPRAPRLASPPVLAPSAPVPAAVPVRAATPAGAPLEPFISASR